MSTVQDGADIGLAEPDPQSITDGDSTVANVQQSESRNGAEQPSSIVAALQSVRETDPEEEHINQNGGSFGSYGRIIREGEEEDEASIQNAEEVLVSPARERPSSADGSLSTPDDTPSVQVGSESMLCLRRPLSSTELGNFFAREAPIFWSGTQSIPLSSPLRQAIPSSIVSITTPFPTTTVASISQYTLSTIVDTWSDRPR